MKKIAILFLMISILLGIAGCSIADSEGNLTHVCSEILKEEAYGENYAIFSLKNGKYSYHLLWEDEVFYCETTERYPEITAVSDHLLEIRVGHGTGVSSSKYCNVNDKTTSVWYEDVLFFHNERILRLEYDRNKESGKRHSIVETKVFTEENLQTIEFDDISDDPMPICEGIWVDQNIEIEYYTTEGTTKKLKFPAPSGD